MEVAEFQRLLSRFPVVRPSTYCGQLASSSSAVNAAPTRVVAPAASAASPPAQKAVTQQVSYEDLFDALQSVIAVQTNNAEQAVSITQAFRRRIESQLQK